MEEKFPSSIKMINSINFKIKEFFLLFIIIPVLFALDFYWVYKAIIGISGFIYVVYVLLKIEGKQFKISKELDWNTFLKKLLLRFLWIVIATSLFVYFTDEELLFKVFVSNWRKWLMFTIMYIVFSVYPQEIIFRTFFFERYSELFPKKSVIVFLNATIFALAHVFYRNALVVAITFVGGWLFARTFYRTGSTLMVTIEHIIFGSWLYLIGMGGALGFPD